MTRLAAQVKLQFYPTPPKVTTQILSHLQFPDSGRVAALDPCAGEGVALATLRGTYRGLLTHAVELDNTRFLMCRDQHFTQVAQGNTVSDVKFAKHAYDLLWFNPPYDYDPDFGRLEMAFFDRVIAKDRSLAPGGIFIGILPKVCFSYLWVHLRDYLDDLVIVKFPVDEYSRFHQFVVFGRMRQSKRRRDDLSHHDDTRLQLAIEEEAVGLLDDLEAVYTVPDRKEPPPPMYVKVFQPWYAYQLAAKHGWMSRASMQDTFWPKPHAQVRTLLPLRETFIGVAVGGGLFNNIPLNINGRNVLVKGRTRKAQAYARSKTKIRNDGSEKREDTYVEQFMPEVFETVLWSPIPEEIGQTRLYELPHQKAGDKK